VVQSVSGACISPRPACASHILPTTSRDQQSSALQIQLFVRLIFRHSHGCSPGRAGDIAGSPLYLYSVVFYGTEAAPRPSRESVLGATSMIVWILTWLLVGAAASPLVGIRVWLTLCTIQTQRHTARLPAQVIKYTFVMLHADDNGQGAPSGHALPGTGPVGLAACCCGACACMPRNHAGREGVAQQHTARPSPCRAPCELCVEQ